MANSYQQTAAIDAGLDLPTILTEIDIYDINTVVGQSDYETIGFGIYAENGHAIRTYFDIIHLKIFEASYLPLLYQQL